MYDVYEDKELQKRFISDFNYWYKNKTFKTIKEYGSYLIEFLINHFDGSEFDVSDEDLETKSGLTIEVSGLDCPMTQVEDVVYFVTHAKPFNSSFVSACLNCMDTDYVASLFILGSFKSHRLATDYRIKLIDVDSRLSDTVKATKQLISFSRCASIIKQSITTDGMQAWNDLIILINKTSPNLIQRYTHNNNGFKLILSNPSEENIRSVYSRLANFAEYLRVTKLDSINLITQKLNAGVVVHVVKPVSDIRVNTQFFILIC